MSITPNETPDPHIELSDSSTSSRRCIFAAASRGFCPFMRGRTYTSRATQCQSLTCVQLESNIIASDTPAHSMAALYSTFISGLTLLQALAIQRDIIPHRRSARGLRSCTSVLVTYATLFPEARKSKRGSQESGADNQNHSGSPSTISSTVWRTRRQIKGRSIERQRVTFNKWNSPRHCSGHQLTRTHHSRRPQTGLTAERRRLGSKRFWRSKRSYKVIYSKT